jgi:MFS family permease
LRPQRPMLVCTVLVLLMAPAVALLALRAPAPLIAAAQAIGGMGLGFFGAVWQTTLQQHVPEEALSRVSAWDWMGTFAFLPLGLILAGPVSQAIGISTTLWISVGYLVISTLAVMLVPSVRNLRRLDAQQPEPRAALPLTGDPAVEAFRG